MTDEKKQATTTETPEQKELRELRQEKANLEKQLAEKEKDLEELIGGNTPSPIPSSKGAFPGNIKVLRLKRDEFKNPTGYEEIEVPEEIANEQLEKPIGSRSKPYQDICFKEQANPKFLA